MEHRSLLEATPTALAAIHQFHRLHQASLRGAILSSQEQRLMALLLDLFEPVRITGAGLERHPVRLRLSLQVVMHDGQRSQRAHLRWLALRALALENLRPLCAGTWVRLALRDNPSHRWLRFRGQVERSSSSSLLTVVLLDRKAVGPN